MEREQENKPSKEPIIRIRLIGISFIFAFLLIGMRAMSVQIKDSSMWKERADRQHTRTKIVQSKKLNITDVNGIYLAVDKRQYSLYVEPKKIENIGDVVDYFVENIGVDRKDLELKIMGGGDFAWVKRRLSRDTYDEIKKEMAGKPGVGFIVESGRFYPWGSVCSALIGSDGIDGDGLVGLEKDKNKQLTLRDRYLVVERDALGREIYTDLGEDKIDVGKDKEEYASGNDSNYEKTEMKLPLDVLLTAKLYKKIDKNIGNGYKKISGMLIDVNASAMKSYFSVPSYDPNSTHETEINDLCDLNLYSYFTPGAFYDFLLLKYLGNTEKKMFEKYEIDDGEYAYLVVDKNYVYREVSSLATHVLSDAHNALSRDRFSLIKNGVNSSPSGEMIPKIINMRHFVGDFLSLNSFMLVDIYSKAIFDESIAANDVFSPNNERKYVYPNKKSNENEVFVLKDDYLNASSDGELSHVREFGCALGWFYGKDRVYILVVNFEGVKGGIRYADMASIWNDVKKTCNEHDNNKLKYEHNYLLNEYTSAKNKLDEIEKIINKTYMW